MKVHWQGDKFEMTGTVFSLWKRNNKVGAPKHVKVNQDDSEVDEFGIKDEKGYRFVPKSECTILEM